MTVVPARRCLGLAGAWPGIPDTCSEARLVSERSPSALAPHPPEFRRRAVELARLREKPVAEIAKDPGISQSCLRNWTSQADINEGRKEGLTTEERAELVRLRRENRMQAREIESTRLTAQSRLRT